MNENSLQEPVARIASTDSVTVPLFRLGARAERAVLVAHATGFHGRSYQPLAAALSRLEAWAPDLRGHGDASSPASGRYHWQGFADDVLAVVDWLDRPLLACGHSMGGAALLLAEIRRPGSFEAIYCWEPIVYPPRIQLLGDSPLVERTRRRRDTFASLEEAIANFAAKPPLDALHPDALRAYVEHGFERLPGGERCLKLPAAEEAEVYRMSLRHEAFARLGEVRCPVTVAHGRRDGVGPAEVAGEVAAALPRGRLESWEDLGHFGPLEDPARVGAAVERALLDPPW
ncbi:MAG TPA: alpha/beta hydrolase [Thermoanaerobaculia bacterium]|nr:alpha/beta hydrolase [Thermoanaerobaculia bacterium]